MNRKPVMPLTFRLRRSRCLHGLSASGFFPAVLAAALLTSSGCAWYHATFVDLPPPPEPLGVITPLDLSQHTVPEKTGDAVAPKTPDNDNDHQNQQPPKPKPPPPPVKLDLTIEECRQAALANNLKLQAALVNPHIAHSRIGEEEARFETVFTADTSYVDTDTPTSTRLEGSSTHRWEFKSGVSMPLRTGGTLNFNLADRKTKTDNAFSTLNPAYETDFSISFSQPLLRNAGRRTATYGIQLARYEEERVQAITRLEVIRVLAAVDRVYWRLYATRRVLEVRRQDYKLAEQQLETARRLVHSGERSPVEIARAEAALASRLEGIINAENALRDRQRELKRVIHRPDLPLDSATIIVPATEPDPVHYSLSAKKLVDAALRNRMELLELEIQLGQDESTIAYLKNQLLPLVTLDYVYNVNGLGSSRWDSYDLLTDKRFTDHVFGAHLLVPIGNQAAEQRLQQAFLTRRQRLTTKENRVCLITQEVLASMDALEAGWQRILANRQSTLLAKRLLDTETRQYKLGLNTSNDLLEAQNKLADAQSAEIQALTEYEIARVDLAYATGTVLGAAKIRWK